LEQNPSLDGRQPETTGGGGDADAEAVGLAMG
jgi:hypothetical protein